MQGPKVARLQQNRYAQAERNCDARKHGDELPGPTLTHSPHLSVTPARAPWHWSSFSMGRVMCFPNTVEDRSRSSRSFPLGDTVSPFPRGIGDCAGLSHFGDPTSALSEATVSALQSSLPKALAFKKKITSKSFRARLWKGCKPCPSGLLILPTCLNSFGCYSHLTFLLGR